MADLKVFRRGADGRDVELQGSTVAREQQELQRRVEAALEPMLGVRFLASEYVTGPWHQGRIDTLGLDEDGVPVIIEFKRRRDAGVITQAASYLVWLLAHRHEFEALVRRRLGADVAEAVDWRRPRVICVAGEFSRHDRAAASLYQRDYRVDLVRYRVFGPDLLTLQLVETVPGFSAAGFAPMPSGAGEAADDEPDVVAVPSGSSQVEVPGCLRELYGELDEALTAAGELEVVLLKHYIAYRRLLNVASVIFRPSVSHRAILVYLRLNPDSVELEEGFTRDVRGIGHLGTGDLEVRIASSADVEKAVPLIRRAVEES
ncbi:MULTISPECIES: DUF5655 domain-containing protein [Streptomycetaceae]|uniref:DUF5655 domain-containing protein n=1 Tax=Streptomycetaceae TaxID=2062 RepID=UPI00093E0A09|nr:DUF5655 domain-containing protein [Streptomyces sp. CB02056]OKI06395.1 hypothetical protein AMK13_17495 [Streptomyces sp. CB02056]